MMVKSYYVLDVTYIQLIYVKKCVMSILYVVMFNPKFSVVRDDTSI
jgi:hypothetical protein